MQLIDQLGRKLKIENIPKRIVSLVPSLTELICDLGLESSLVGITKFCVHPKSIRETAKIVGGTKQVHFNKIRDLNSDIILCNKEENTLDMIHELEKIAPIHISDINNIDDCLEIIENYGYIFNVESQSNAIVENIRIELNKFELFVKTQPSITVAYFIWKDPWMAVGSETFIDYMLSINGFKNYYENKSRYPEIDIKNVYNNVDLVMLSSEPYPFKKKHFQEIEHVFPNARIIIVDGEMFSWYGSRLQLAFSYFKKLHTTIQD